jgi:hypothetical protein
MRKLMKFGRGLFLKFNPASVSEYRALLAGQGIDNLVGGDTLSLYPKN